MSKVSRKIDKIIDDIKSFINIDKEDYRPRNLGKMSKSEKKTCYKDAKHEYYEARAKALFDIAYNANTMFYHAMKKDDEPKRIKLKKYVEKLHDDVCDNGFIEFLLKKKSMIHENKIAKPYIAGLLYRLLFDRSRKIAIVLRDDDGFVGEFIYKYLDKRIDYFKECGAGYGAIELSCIFPDKTNQYDEVSQYHVSSIFISTLVWLYDQTNFDLIKFVKKFSKEANDKNMANSMMNEILVAIMRTYKGITSTLVANHITRDIAAFLENTKYTRIYLIKRYFQEAIRLNDSNFMSTTMFKLNEVTEDKYPKLYDIITNELEKVNFDD